MRFFIILGQPGVYAWDLPQAVNPLSLDVRRYAELALRAAAAVVQPLGTTEQDAEVKRTLKDRVLEDTPRLPMPLSRPRLAAEVV